MDLPLAKAKPISNSGSTSVITQKGRRRRCLSYNIKKRGEKVLEQTDFPCRSC